MQLRTKHKHMIDLLFPVALFFVFALSALTLLLLAARIYRSTTENSSLNYTSRTGLSYISEKIHQCDTDGLVSIGTFDGCDALIMKQQRESGTYYTYIYTDGRNLKELFIKEGADAVVSDGNTILKIRDFTMKQITENLFQFTCTDEKNRTSSVLIGIRIR